MKNRNSRILIVGVVLLVLAAMTAMLVGLAPERAAAQAPQPAGSGIVNQPKGVTTPDYYIVRLADAPLALYQGGVADLAPTSPTALGTAKLDARSAASQAYLSYLNARQDDLVAGIENVIGGAADVAFRYQAAYNGIAVWLTPDQAAEVAKLPGVLQVNRSYERVLTTYAGPEWIGADAIWDGTATGGLPGTEGEGIVVGILDSGINMDHPSYADVGADGYDHTNPLGSGNYRGWCDLVSPPAPVTCNDKLIGVYSYTASGDDPEDDNGHGSHTAGTAAGNVVTATISGADIRISGVAPHANIIAYDVCTVSSCPIASILAGIDDVTLDADLVSVLNYSIGADVDSDPWGDDDSLAFLGAFAAGILPVTSNGNAGPNPNTVGSPANAPWMMSVGWGTHNGIIGHDFDVTGPGSVPGNLMDLPAVPGSGPDFTTDIASSIVWAGAVDAGNFEGCSPWTGTPFTGAIALISRGSCTFAAKVDNAAAAGADAVIVFNHLAGELPFGMGGLATTTIPSAMLGNVDGIAVRDWVLNSPSATAAIEASVSAVFDDTFGNRMNGSSSRGPTFASEVIKPDIAAPGNSILAAYLDSSGGFTLLSGTSMASPHTAGAAALLKALHPEWSPQEIRSALMTTADTNVTQGNGIDAADPFDTGSGFVNLREAAEVGLVMEESEADYLAADPGTMGDSTTLNIASLQNSQCVASCSWTRVFTNTTALTWEYDVTVDTPAGATGTATPSNFTIAGGDSVTVTIQIDVAAVGDGSWQFGQVNLSLAPPPGPTAGGITPVDQHLPIAFIPAASTMPGYIEIFDNDSMGSVVITDVVAITLTNSTTATYGFAPASFIDVELAVDPTNGDAYDDLSQVAYYTVTVPAGAQRLVAEIVASEAEDVDLFWGSGAVPSAATQLGLSATATALEYLNYNEPPAGVYWVLVQNWSSASGQATDTIRLSLGLVTTDAGNFTVSLPSSNDIGVPFDVTVSYDDPSLESAGYWYGAFTLAPDGAAEPFSFTAVDFHIEHVLNLPSIIFN